MKTFLLTNHAEIRMKERSIPSPSDIRLKSAGRKMRKIIRKNCLINGYKNEWGSEFVYYTNNRYVFVCVIKDIATYLVITAFDITQEKNIEQNIEITS